MAISKVSIILSIIYISHIFAEKNEGVSLINPKSKFDAGLEYKLILKKILHSVEIIRREEISEKSSSMNPDDLLSFLENSENQEVLQDLWKRLDNATKASEVNGNITESLSYLEDLPDLLVISDCDLIKMLYIEETHENLKGTDVIIKLLEQIDSEEREISKMGGQFEKEKSEKELRDLFDKIFKNYGITSEILHPDIFKFLLPKFEKAIGDISEHENFAEVSKVKHSLETLRNAIHAFVSGPSFKTTTDGWINSLMSSGVSTFLQIFSFDDIKELYSLFIKHENSLRPLYNIAQQMKTDKAFRSLRKMKAETNGKVAERTLEDLEKLWGTLLGDGGKEEERRIEL